MFYQFYFWIFIVISIFFFFQFEYCAFVIFVLFQFHSFILIKTVMGIDCEARTNADGRIVERGPKPIRRWAKLSLAISMLETIIILWQISSIGCNKDQNIMDKFPYSRCYSIIHTFAYSLFVSQHPFLVILPNVILCNVRLVIIFLFR